ncbi:MAG TPA: hypothetical protein VKZ91_01470 [Woeseiaceae bacterium]|nr:hypothetical protein [Woeseiaceae bacterium]
MKKQPKSLTDELETHLCRCGSECATILGVAMSTYAEYKAGNIPRAARNHIDVILRLPLDRLHQLIKDRLTNG